MDIYSEEGDIQKCIQCAIRVAAYQWADYTEMTVSSAFVSFPWQTLTYFMIQFPTTIARAFFKLGQIHGHGKISFTLLSMGLPEQILKIMDSYLQYGKVFKVEGWDF